MPAADSISKPIQWRRAFIDLWVNRQWTWTSCLLNYSHSVVALGPLQNLQAAAHITICLNHRGGNYGVLKWIENPRLDVFIHHRYCSLNRCRKTDYIVPRELCNTCLLKGDREKYLCQWHYPSILPGNPTNDVSGDLENWHASWNLWGEIEKSFCYVVHTCLSVRQAAYIRLHR